VNSIPPTEIDQEVVLRARPRKQFRPFLERTQRWACLVCHRRAGKTVACIQDLLQKAHTDTRVNPPRRYAYIAPTRDQSKDIAWAMLKRFVSDLPNVKVNEQDLMVTLSNGAMIRLYSGDSYERMRGLYFDYVVLDEYANLDPQAWLAVIRPALADYQGRATFIGTPAGRNGFWRLWKEALDDPEWFTMILRSSESGLIPPEELESIKAGTPERVFAQEFECNFSVGRAGSIYSRVLEDARIQTRISNNILWHKESPVYSSWDVGAPLNVRVWLWQILGDRIVFLESLFGDADCSTPADWVKRLLDRPYRYASHFLPHDAAAINGSLWQPNLQTAGLTNVVAVQRQNSVWDGINLALDAFPRVSFKEDTCQLGLDALDLYHSKEESDGITIKQVPVHDHSSHASDAFSIAFQAIKAGLVIDRSQMPTRVNYGYQVKRATHAKMGFKGA